MKIALPATALVLIVSTLARTGLAQELPPVLPRTPVPTPRQPLSLGRDVPTLGPPRTGSAAPVSTAPLVLRGPQLPGGGLLYQPIPDALTVPDLAPKFDGLTLGLPRSGTPGLALPGPAQDVPPDADEPDCRKTPLEPQATPAGVVEPRPSAPDPQAALDRAEASARAAMPPDARLATGPAPDPLPGLRRVAQAVAGELASVPADARVPALPDLDSLDPDVRARYLTLLEQSLVPRGPLCGNAPPPDPVSLLIAAQDWVERERWKARLERRDGEDEDDGSWVEDFEASPERDPEREIDLPDGPPPQSVPDDFLDDEEEEEGTDGAPANDPTDAAEGWGRTEPEASAPASVPAAPSPEAEYRELLAQEREWGLSAAQRARKLELLVGRWEGRVRELREQVEDAEHEAMRAQARHGDMGAVGRQLDGLRDTLRAANESLVEARFRLDGMLSERAALERERIARETRLNDPALDTIEIPPEERRPVPLVVPAERDPFAGLEGLVARDRARLDEAARTMRALERALSAGSLGRLEGQTLDAVHERIEAAERLYTFAAANATALHDQGAPVGPTRVLDDALAALDASLRAVADALGQARTEQTQADLEQRRLEALLRMQDMDATLAPQDEPAAREEQARAPGIERGEPADVSEDSGGSQGLAVQPLPPVPELRDLEEEAEPAVALDAEAVQARVVEQQDRVVLEATSDAAQALARAGTHPEAAVQDALGVLALSAPLELGDEARTALDALRDTARATLARRASELQDALELYGRSSARLDAQDDAATLEELRTTGERCRTELVRLTQLDAALEVVRVPAAERATQLRARDSQGRSDVDVARRALARDLTGRDLDDPEAQAELRAGLGRLAARRAIAEGLEEARLAAGAATRADALNRIALRLDGSWTRLGEATIDAGLRGRLARARGAGELGDHAAGGDEGELEAALVADEIDALEARRARLFWQDPARDELSARAALIDELAARERVQRERARALLDDDELDDVAEEELARAGSALERLDVAREAEAVRGHYAAWTAAQEAGDARGALEALVLLRQDWIEGQQRGHARYLARFEDTAWYEQGPLRAVWVLGTMEEISELIELERGEMADLQAALVAAAFHAPGELDPAQRALLEAHGVIRGGETVVPPKLALQAATIAADVLGAVALSASDRRRLVGEGVLASDALLPGKANLFTVGRDSSREFWADQLLTPREIAFLTATVAVPGAIAGRLARGLFAARAAAIAALAGSSTGARVLLSRTALWGAERASEALLFTGLNRAARTALDPGTMLRRERWTAGELTSEAAHNLAVLSALRLFGAGAGQVEGRIARRFGLQASPWFRELATATTLGGEAGVLTGGSALLGAGELSRRSALENLMVVVQLRALGSLASRPRAPRPPVDVDPEAPTVIDTARRARDGDTLADVRTPRPSGTEQPPGDDVRTARREPEPRDAHDLREDVDEARVLVGGTPEGSPEVDALVARHRHLARVALMRAEDFARGMFDGGLRLTDADLEGIDARSEWTPELQQALERTLALGEHALGLGPERAREALGDGFEHASPAERVVALERCQRDLCRIAGEWLDGLAVQQAELERNVLLARAAGVAEPDLERALREAFLDDSTVHALEDAIRTVRDLTLAVQDVRVIADEAVAARLLTAITRVLTGVAGEAEARVLHAHVEAATRAGLDWFAELGRIGTLGEYENLEPLMLDPENIARVRAYLEAHPAPAGLRVPTALIQVYLDPTVRYTR